MINDDLFIIQPAGELQKKSHPLKPYNHPNHPWIKTARTWNTKAAKKEHPAPCQIVLVFEFFFVILPSPPQKKHKTYPSLELTYPLKIVPSQIQGLC